MGRSRDYRRAQRARIIARTEKWMREYGLIGGRFCVAPQAEQDQAVRRRATTPHPCSCFGCGNPRRWFDGDEALTRQELKARLRERDED